MLRSPSEKSRSRHLAEVKPSLDRSLKAYAIAAGAAGVGLAALALPAEGKIVFTAVHQTIHPGGTLRMDLNGDGVTDFTLIDSYHTSFAAGRIRNTGSIHPSAGAVNIYGGVASNVVAEATSPQFFAAGFAAGVSVNSKLTFIGAPVRPALEACYGTGGFVSGQSGQWTHATNRYLGLKFVINGQTHFGWARVNIKLEGTDIGCQYQVVLAGFAYETIANKPITTGKTKGPTEVASMEPLTPQPAAVEPGLGMLALGSRGLNVWRREEELQG